MAETPSNPPRDVVVFPLPLQGPLNCMLKLAELLCISGLRVTFINTIQNHRRLLRFSAADSRFSRLPPSAFRFETFPDGLPDDHPRSGDRILDLFLSVQAASQPLLRRILTSPCRRNSCCVIADGLFSFAADITDDVGVPLIYFETISPCCLWVYLSLPKLIHDGELPFSRDGDLDAPIKSVAGMEGFLRRRDLPDFCRAGNLSDPVLRLVLAETAKIPKARGLILNTFEALESPEVLSNMRALTPNLYCVGPLHSLYSARLRPPAAASNSLWKEDDSCLGWLDAQPPRSVVYVSIGSVAVMSAAQALEIRHGLVGSGHRFLWVQRPGSIAADVEGTRVPEGSGGCAWGRGLVVEWAPQVAVLEHAAVGAFLTHGGWNSTLESIAAGVPMVCWPHFVDQLVNSRHVSHAWGVGVDMKDACDRATVERMVRDVMGARREEFSRSAQRTAELAGESVSAGGTSYSDLDRLIDDLRVVT